MCGRARCTLRPDDVPRACNRHGFPARFLHLECFRPSYNVAPGSYLPVLRRDNDGVAVHCMKWGLVPGFTKRTDKPDFFKMFNARSESVAEKAPFRRLLPKNRGLVAVDGFYEWKKEGSKKQPYYIHFKDGRPLVFAALFDSWQNSGGETLYTFTILTTASSSALDWLHDRMPVILSDKDSVDTWLDDPSTSKLKPLLAPYENSDLVWYPVTSAIGKLSFDGPECTQQIPLKASQNSLISNFFSAKQPKTEESDKETRLTDVKEEPMIEGYEGVVVSDNDEEVKEPDEGKDSSNEAEEKIVKAEPFTEGNSAVASHLEAVKNKVEGGINGEGESIETGRTNEIGESKIVKAEPFIEDNSAVASHLESVKNAVEEGINGEGESIETGFTNETDESYNIDIPRISKEEHETQGHSIPANKDLNQLKIQHQVVQDKPRNENYCEGMKEGALEFSVKSSGKSGTKRDYDLLSEQEKPSKHNVRLQDVSKSCGKQGRKQGKGKSNIKKSKETQSTLHFFFDEK